MKDVSNYIDFMGNLKTRLHCMQKYHSNKFFVLVALMFLLSGLSFADEPVFPEKDWEERTPESQE